jgi:hypothetical protein
VAETMTEAVTFNRRPIFAEPDNKTSLLSYGELGMQAKKERDSG